MIFYKTLLTLHSAHPALRIADDQVATYFIATTEQQQVFSFLRRRGDHEVFVVLNLSTVNELPVTVNDEMIHGTYKNIFMGDTIDLYRGSTLQLKAWDFLVFAK